MRLARHVTTFTAACVLISNMVGTGIFGTSGYMARDLGSPRLILLLWLLGGVYALLGAWCYSELGAAMPRAGGEYVYIREAYGPLCGFLSGWTSFAIVFSAAIASSAHLFATHVQQLFGISLDSAAVGGPPYLTHTQTIGLLMVWALTAVHAAGTWAGGLVQRVLTSIKIAAIALLMAAGLATGRGDWQHLFAGHAGQAAGLNAALVSFLFVSYSYSGWNAASYIAEEIADPQRNIPKATVWGAVSVAVLYLALNLFYFYALPVERLAAEPVAPVAQKTAAALLGPRIGPWLTALLCLSILATASAMIWAGPRVYFAMARDGVFPAVFAETTAQQVPARSIVLQSGWVSILVVCGGFEQLVLYAGFVLVAFSALAVLAVPVLRWKRPELPRPYRVSFYPLAPLLYVAGSVAVMWAGVRLKPRESLLGILTVLAGVPFYFFWRGRARARAGVKNDTTGLTMNGGQNETDEPADR